VHRAKRQLEKSMAQQAGQKEPAAPFELPVSDLVKKNIGGVPQRIRQLTVAVYEQAVEIAIGRGLLGRNETGDPWTVLSALFAAMFEDHTMEWLNKRGYLRWDQRGQGEAIIAAVNALIWRTRRYTAKVAELRQTDLRIDWSEVTKAHAPRRWRFGIRS
jgi:hypothetical protein